MARTVDKERRAELDQSRADLEQSRAQRDEIKQRLDRARQLRGSGSVAGFHESNNVMRTFS